MRRFLICLIFVFFMISIVGCSKEGAKDQLITNADDLLSTMVKVGDTGVTYTFPSGSSDTHATATGGFYIAAHETTYELWYHVRKWAEANGFHFRRCGDEGSQDLMTPSSCSEPSSRKLEPVTNVTWIDTVVWLNVLSQLQGLDPVYRTPTDVILKDARFANSEAFEDVVQTNNNGYRLPTPQEWEMAARWRTASGQGAISVGGRYWSPSSYASGATDGVTNASVLPQYAWFEDNANDKTQAVGQKSPNALNLYDMSGNVSELTFRKFIFKYVYGGSFKSNASGVRVFEYYSYFDNVSTNDVGFRIVKNS